MGSSEGKELVEARLAMYRHIVMNLRVLEEQDQRVIDLTDLAGTYADEVMASLPEDDLVILRQGLTGAFLAFLVDAALVLNEAAA